MSIWAFPAFYPFDFPGSRWHGIFAHRQYKGLIANGADLKVIMPVMWHPPYPVSELHPEWKKSRVMDYPAKTVYDSVTVYYPRIANFKPNRFVKKTYAERYIDAITGFFHKNNITLDPAKDIFYSQWLPDSVLVQEAAHRLGVKSAILSIGDDVVLWPYWKKENMQLFQTLMVEADYRFACSDYLGRLANSILGKDLSYEVVYMGVEHGYFKPFPAAEKKSLKEEYKLPSSKTIILTIGTAKERKGWLDLFDALQEIKKKEDNFFLVGAHAGPPEIDLDEEVAKRGLTDNFLNLGEVPPAQVNKIYNLADIFCLPSHSEGLANVVVEAASSGLPVITTDVGGHAELITSGVNGILIPPKRPDILQATLSILIDDKDMQQELGTAARKFMVNELGDFTKTSERLYKILTGKIRFKS